MNIYKIFSQKLSVLFSVVAMAALFAVPTVSLEAATFNTHPNDCPTVMVATLGNEPTTSYGCWNTSDSVSDGEEVNFAIYYHNTGSSPESVKIELDNPSSNDAGSETLSGRVLVGGQVVASGSATITFSGGDGHLVPVRAFNEFMGGAGLTSLSYGQVLGPGASIGTVQTSGTYQQGVVKVAFRAEVENTPNPTNDEPVATTGNADADEDSVDLEGEYDMNDFSNGDVFFVMDEDRGNVEDVDDEDNLSDAEDLVDFYDLVDSGADGDNVNVDTSFDDLDEDTRYYYSLCILFENDNNDDEITCGAVRSFTTDGSSEDEPEVDITDEDHDQDSVTLEGRYDMNDFSNGDVFFVMDESRGNVEDVEDQDSLSDARDEVEYYRLVDSDADGRDTVDTSFSNLDENTRYYYTICVLYEDDNNDDTILCDSVHDFRTDGDSGPTGNIPSIETLPIIDKGPTFAVLDGYYGANGCSVSTWFEYGISGSLTYTAGRVNRGNTSGAMPLLIDGLRENTTYSYRAVAENCEGIAYGSIRTFTTMVDKGGYVPTPVVPSGDANKFVRLSITNHEDIVRSGDELDYDISWKNVSGKRLEDVILEVTIPEGLRITDIEGGKVNKRSNSVIIEIDELSVNESGETTVEVCVRRGKFKDGDPVVARAIMAFENPVNGTDLEALAYDADEYRGGRSLGGGGFFPTTFLGWLIILLVIAILGFVVRSLVRREKKSETPVAPTNNEYVPYRPTPKSQ